MITSMATNADLMSAVRKVKQTIHKRFLSSAQSLEVGCQLVGRKISPQRIFDLRSDKFRVSRSKSKEKNVFSSPGTRLKAGFKASLDTGKESLPSIPTIRCREEDTLAEAISWQERLGVYETTITALAKKVRQLKAEIVNLKTLPAQVRFLESRVEEESVKHHH